ncbi:phenylalanine--tRNA ligase subunit beta [Ferrovum myxofaciens]|uniref:Phenylalanine--tRNA ligase beta subunit n=4 Tax=root TaxID=1 RepID=A0A8F3E0L7_9PROT|nr:phenylalanine--tRNA ligase subunit beta [Ferrovum myxofaciens]MBW8028998.1 phenylalanine--tRNA ligase subunit beta [Ferrovum sp.]KXW57925.1 phenylalanine--tRNA ligase beta subunit [Ferrovum myxofaciens]MBU6994129.1 phenylalanine--tRNA ligase subunit beta [Ferrovum myxofaciens]QKE38071.1 MAG: phenylalanine--tRNA ligase subunit beta [Ferrovum myxofaciens]QWY75790.1 MAG: phenylalanine--tRNA ligase subunit beta [Ferrovum myxofaciens]
MKFSEAWLRTWVDPDLDAAELAHVLTMGGLEVEALSPCAPPFDQVVVGQILTVEKHPQADRLNCLTVDVGTSEPLPIVCGAPNVAVGMKAPCALVGAVLPGDLTIKAAKVRGIESQGMMCSARELGLNEESEGLLALDAQAPVGQSLRVWLDLDDQQFTLKLTPNRADCLSMRGVAREVAALTQCSLTPPIFISREANPEFGTRTVQIDAREGCARYGGRVIHLEQPDQPTPDWMVRRLERAGLRAKALVVDVTNYVMLELGQPLHAFADAALTGNLTVRWAREGESLTVLSGQTLALTADLLVVADEAGPQALAGLMGGQNSAVSAQTQDIFLEAAWFSPGALAGRARRLGLASEAAFRFERGVDASLTQEALERATQLLLDYAGGGQAGPILDLVHPEKLPRRLPVRVRPDRVRRLLGFEVAVDTMRQILTRLGVGLEGNDVGWTATAPTWRVDLEREVDYVEEIARCVGYDQIPMQVPRAPLRAIHLPERERSRQTVAQRLQARGFQEVITYSFVPPEGEQRLAMQPSILNLLNPLSQDLAVMRSTLSVGLMETLVFNLKRKQEQVRIFEWGRCFLPARDTDGLCAQPLRLGGLWYGTRFPEQWGIESESADFFDLKGVVEELLPSGASFVSTQHPALHPGRSAEVWWNGQSIGWLGELHPRLGPSYDLSRMPLLFELEWIPLTRESWPEYGPTPRFQPVRRDLALVVEESIPAMTLWDALRAAAPKNVADILLFDVYQGAGVEEGKKSLAFCVKIQDTERSSTEGELEQICQELIGVAERRFGAVLR